MKRILFLEDDVKLLKLYNFCLQYAGFSVFWTPSLYLAETGFFDLILADVEDPSQEFMLAQIQYRKQLPVLVLGGHAQRCYNLNLHNLPRPFTASQLVATIHKLISEFETHSLKSG